MTELVEIDSVSDLSTRQGADVDDLINASTFGSFHYALLSICVLALLVEGFDYQSMALVIRAIGLDWHQSPASFSAALASLSAGQGVGGILIGSASDRWGRRNAILGSFILIAAVSLATSTAVNVTQLSIWRFLTGLGISGVAVTTYALIIDSVPARRRALCLALLFSFFSLGGFLMGFLAPLIINAAGWKGIFWFGAIAPVPVIVLMYFFLPESIKVLVRSNAPAARVRAQLRRMGACAVAERVVVRQTDRGRTSVLTLLQSPYRYRTLAWWGIYFTNAFVFYGLVGWLPTLLAGMSFPPADAQRISSMIWAGTFAGGLALSVIFDQVDRKQVPLFFALGLALAALLASSVVSSHVFSWGVLLFALGLGVGSIQLIIPALGALIYPPSILGAGLGMGGVVSRIGHIVVPLLGGLAIAHGAGMATFMGWLTIPVVLTSVCTAALFSRRETSARD